eukprot:scaffold238330_cov29-Prasinocladus_malaysianus.AAC.1
MESHNGKRPDDIPANPNDVYDAWLGWDDFLMTETTRKEKLRLAIRAIDGLDDDDAVALTTPVRETRSGGRSDASPATPRLPKTPPPRKTSTPVKAKLTPTAAKPSPRPKPSPKPKPPSVTPERPLESKPPAKQRPAAIRVGPGKDFVPTRPLLNG